MGGRGGGGAGARVGLFALRVHVCQIRRQFGFLGTRVALQHTPRTNGCTRTQLLMAKYQIIPQAHTRQSNTSQLIRIFEQHSNALAGKPARQRRCPCPSHIACSVESTSAPDREVHASSVGARATEHASVLSVQTSKFKKIAACASGSQGVGTDGARANASGPIANLLASNPAAPLVDELQHEPDQEAVGFEQQPNRGSGAVSEASSFSSSPPAPAAAGGGAEPIATTKKQ